MASDSDPRLKPNRTSRLSKTQMTALGLLCFVIIVSMATYYSEVLWEIEHVKKAHAYLSEKATVANQYAYQMGESIHQTQAMQSINSAAQTLGTGLAPAIGSMVQWGHDTFESLNNNLWYGYYDYYYGYYSSYYSYGYSYYGYDYSSYSVGEYGSYSYYSYYEYDEEFLGMTEDFNEQEWAFDEGFWNDYAPDYYMEQSDFWTEASALEWGDLDESYAMTYSDWEYLDYFDPETGYTYYADYYYYYTGDYLKFDDDEFDSYGDYFWPDFDDYDDVFEFAEWSKDWQFGKEQSNFHDLARLDETYFDDFNDYYEDYELLHWAEGVEQRKLQGGGRRRAARKVLA